MELSIVKTEKNTNTSWNIFVFPCIYSVFRVQDNVSLGKYSSYVRTTQIRGGVVLTFEFGWEVTKITNQEKETSGEIGVPFPIITPSSALRLVCLTNHLQRMLPAFGWPCIFQPEMSKCMCKHRCSEMLPIKN